MFCGKCGKEVAEGYEFCMGCGERVELITEHAIQPMIALKKKKHIIPVAVILFVIVVIVATVFLLNSYKKRAGLYNDIPWQISYEELCKLVETKKTGEIICDDKQKIVFETINNYRDDIGVDVIIFYKCDDAGTLRNTYLMINNGDGSKHTDFELFNKYEKELSNLYGEKEPDSVISTWKTSKSTIKLANIVDGVITIDYQDITYGKD